jgi:hypothetical protein
MPLLHLGSVLLAVPVLISAVASLAFIAGQSDKASQLFDYAVNERTTKNLSNKEAAEGVRPKGNPPSANVLPLATESFGNPCDILTQGNRLYSSSKFEQAIAVYRTVERVDKTGSHDCTDSVYASIASSLLILAHQAQVSDISRSAQLYRFAATYNRAFALAIICRVGNCRPSVEFWASDPLA